MSEQTQNKEKKVPRPGWSYRAERKRAARKARRAMLKHAPEVIETIAPAAYCNRSQKWAATLSYAQAREMSPSKEKVR